MVVEECRKGRSKRGKIVIMYEMNEWMIDRYVAEGGVKLW